MKHEILPLETVNALLTEPSTAFGVTGHPDLAIIRPEAAAPEWATELDRIATECGVLGFRTLLLQLDSVGVSTPFEIACLVSAWKLLMDRGGTLVLCCLSEPALKRLEALVEPGQFNIFSSTDESVDWLDTGFVPQVHKSFPRPVTCTECGSLGQVQHRGDHMCPDCGYTYLVTERGELLF